MSYTDPTGGADVVALTIPPDDQRFLRSVFRMALDGIRDELGSYPDELREPARLHREQAVYEALLEALDNGSVSATGDIRAVLKDLAETVDQANEYERVVAEHTALVGLREQLGRGGRQ
jgi:hypothetical protein